MVRAKGFEPLHLTVLDPKSSVSAVPPRPHNVEVGLRTPRALTASTVQNISHSKQFSNPLYIFMSFQFLIARQELSTCLFGAGDGT